MKRQSEREYFKYIGEGSPTNLKSYLPSLFLFRKIYFYKTEMVFFS